MQAINQNAFLCGARIKTERLRLAMTQEVFGSKLGVSKPTQTAYESGGRLPDLAYLNAATELGVDFAYIMTGKSLQVVAAENMNWEILEVLLECISEWEISHDFKISAATRTKLLQLFYSRFTADGKVDPKILQIGFDIAKAG